MRPKAYSISDAANTMPSGRKIFGSTQMASATTARSSIISYTTAGWVGPIPKDRLAGFVHSKPQGSDVGFARCSPLMMSPMRPMAMASSSQGAVTSASLPRTMPALEA